MNIYEARTLEDFEWVTKYLWSQEVLQHQIHAWRNRIFIYRNADGHEYHQRPFLAKDIIIATRFWMQNEVEM